LIIRIGAFEGLTVKGSEEKPNYPGCFRGPKKIQKSRGTDVILK